MSLVYKFSFAQMVQAVTGKEGMKLDMIQTWIKMFPIVDTFSRFLLVAVYIRVFRRIQEWERKHQAQERKISSPFP